MENSLKFANFFSEVTNSRSMQYTKVMLSVHWLFYANLWHSDVRRPTFGDRCFAAAGSRLWNTLPVHLRQCDSLGQFKRLLQTYLFGVWDRSALWRLS